MGVTVSDARHPLTIPYFRAYFVSRLLATIAISAQAIIIGWQVYGIARETMDVKPAAFLLGMIGLVQFVPLFLLTPVVGLVADTYDRRWIARATTLLLTLNAAALGLLTWTGNLSLPFLFGAAVFIGIARAFSGPAFSALAPNLVPREVLPTAIAVSSIAWQTGVIIGPSVGGVLYAIHPDVAYGTISAMLLAALIAVFLIGKVPQPAVQKDRHPIQRVKDGFAYVRNTGWCSQRSRSTCLWSCSPARPRCSRSTRATSCTSVPPVSASSPPAWVSAPPRDRCGSRSAR